MPDFWHMEPSLEVFLLLYLPPTIHAQVHLHRQFTQRLLPHDVDHDFEMVEFVVPGNMQSDLRLLRGNTHT